jgi:hypothetical protein
MNESFSEFGLIDEKNSNQLIPKLYSTLAN